MALSNEDRARQAFLPPLDIAREFRIDKLRREYVFGRTPFTRSKALREMQREISERSAAARAVFADTQFAA